jgi:hypothetical protein
MILDWIVISWLIWRLLHSRQPRTIFRPDLPPVRTTSRQLADVVRTGAATYEGTCRRLP